jgi:hypothetical protein
MKMLFLGNSPLSCSKLGLFVRYRTERGALAEFYLSCAIFHEISPPHARIPIAGILAYHVLDGMGGGDQEKETAAGLVESVSGIIVMRA